LSTCATTTRNAQNSASFFTTLILLALALLGSASMLYYYVGFFMPRVSDAHTASNLAGGYSVGHDFYPVWLTSRECVPSGCDPYSPGMTRKIQQGMFGRALDSRIPSDPPNDYRTFAYPAFTDLLLWPAALFPFTAARGCFLVLLIAVTALSVLLWMNAFSLLPTPTSSFAVILLVICSYPVLEGLYAVQLGLLVGFLLAASVFALQRGWIFLAGTLMALTTIKPQMTILAIVYLLVWSVHKWRERGRFCIGFVSTIAILTIAAMLVWPHWVQSWVRVLLGYHHYANLPLLGEVFGLGPVLGGTASTGAIALLLTLLLSFKMRSADVNSIEFQLTLSVLLCITSVTLLPSQGFQDQVILLPGIFLVFCRWTQPTYTGTYKVLLVTAAAVLMWPWFAAFGLIALRPLLTHDQFYSKAVFVLPLRTAAVFPFVLLGMLALRFRHPSES
jgi:hypothetical protein